MSKHNPYPPTPFYERLTDLSKLKSGWLDGHGKAPSSEALTSASVLGAALPKAISPRVYPTEAGGISLEWDDQHGGHEIEVLPDGHLFLMSVERTEATDRAKGEHRDPAADTLAEEWHRRYQRLEDLNRDPDTPATVLEHVRGELVGLRGALGVLLGGRVEGGTADLLGWSYYQEWRRRQEGQA